MRQPPSAAAPSFGVLGRHHATGGSLHQRSLRPSGPNQRTTTQFSPATRNFPHKFRLLSRSETEETLGSAAYIGALLNMYNGHLHPLNLCIGAARDRSTLRDALARIAAGSSDAGVLDGPPFQPDGDDETSYALSDHLPVMVEVRQTMNDE